MLEPFPFGADRPTRASTGAEAPPPAVELRHLSVFAGGRPILSEVELTVAPGEILCLLGPSGIGKSTLLKCVNRLVDLEPGLEVRGEVLIEGQPIYRSGVDPDRLRRRVGMLFQQPVIFPVSILDNVVFGLRHGASRTPRRELSERAERALKEVGLWREVRDRLGEPASTLSVGQQQRLCLARTLALEPHIILMDEPTSALDPRSARRIEELALALKGPRTLILVTHDPEQARRVADRAACVAAGPAGAGVVTACAACDDLLRDGRLEELLQGEIA